ncbi:MAG: PepSY-like domain-containing protein [Bacteroidales bacterium]|nr:PepSY-like domain-containing protein [Bacteroidales bacterium]
MKKIVFITLMSICVLATAQTKIKESEVPKAVLLALENTYKSYKVKSWFQNPGQYIAELVVDGQAGKSFFTDAGDWQYSSFPVSVEEMPTLVNTYFDNNYPGYRIKSSEYVEEMSGDNYYRLIIAMKGLGANDYELVFDTRGKLLKNNAPDPVVVKRDFDARKNPENGEIIDERDNEGKTEGKKPRWSKNKKDDANKYNPPKAMVQDFEKRNPKTRVAKGPFWVSRDDGGVAYFSNRNKAEFEAVYGGDNKLIKTGTVMRKERFSRPILKYLAEKFKGEKYKVVKMVRYDFDSKYRDPETGKRPKSYFYVVISLKVKGKSDLQYTRMTFDNNGNFTGLVASPLDERDIQ